MFNKEKTEQQLARAADAKKLLGHPLFESSVVAVKASIFSTIENSKWHRRREREEAYRQLKSLNSVMRVLEKEVETGKLAQQQLTRENSKR